MISRLTFRRERMIASATSPAALDSERGGVVCGVLFGVFWGATKKMRIS